jgi:hypothetical protein
MRTAKGYRSKPLGSVSLSFDKPLPGKPPTRPPLPFESVVFFYDDTATMEQKDRERGKLRRHKDVDHH